MQGWDKEFDRECRSLVEATCDSEATDRVQAWQALLLRTSGHLEQFILHSSLLARCRLASPDDARGVLVEVLSRLARRDFENLRRFLAAQPPGEADDEPELAAVMRLSLSDDVELAAAAPDDFSETPLRGWLIGLSRFAIKDHVKKRLGWSAASMHAPGGALRSRRDLTTDAERIDDQPEQGERPPITDLLAMRQRIDQMLAFSQSFPAEMRAAFELWMQDESFEGIARRLDLAGPERGRALVRAAHARLREKFRGAGAS